MILKTIWVPEPLLNYTFKGQSLFIDSELFKWVHSRNLFLLMPWAPA